MPTRKEQLQKELAEIERKEKEAIADAEAKLQVDVNRPRTIELYDDVYKLTFLGYEKGMPHPDAIEKYLSKPGYVVRHNFDGTIYDVIKIKGVNTVQVPTQAFEPIDKGRPSTVFCDEMGVAIFSFAVYAKEKEIAIYPVKGIHAW